jgi:hypothetical protein
MFRVFLWTSKNNSDLTLLHRVVADDVVDISDVYDAYILIAEMNRFVQSWRWMKHLSPKRRQLRHNLRTKLNPITNLCENPKTE